jgi:hypothetical protein
MPATIASFGHLYFVRPLFRHGYDTRVPKVDVLFRVNQGGHAFGRLRISKGGVEWLQKNDSKKAFHMSWESLDKNFVESGTKGKTRSKKRR